MGEANTAVNYKNICNILFQVAFKDANFNFWSMHNAWNIDKVIFINFKPNKILGSASNTNVM